MFYISTMMLTFVLFTEYWVGLLGTGNIQVMGDMFSTY